MKTLELAEMPEAQLVPLLKDMKLKELERHAQKILTNMGQPDYDKVLSVLIRALPKMTGEKIDRFTAVQNVVKGLLPTASNDSSVDSHLLDRLAVILSMIIKRKFDRILSGV